MVRASYRLAVMGVVLGCLFWLVQAGPTEASVTLSDFRTQTAPDHVRVLWETGTELNNLGFYIWRGTTASRDGASRLTTSLIPSQVGGQATGASYEYADVTATAGAVYYYWLEAVDTSDGRQFEGPVQGTFGGQSPLATVTPGASPEVLPTSTPAPTNTPVPRATAQPTATARPGATATTTFPATAAPPSPTPPMINTPAPATATLPAPTAVPEPMASQAPGEVEPREVSDLPGPTDTGSGEVTLPPTVELAAVVTTDDLEIVGSGALQPTPVPDAGGANMADDGANGVAGEGAAPERGGVAPLTWLGLIAGIVALGSGAGALYLLWRRRSVSSG